MEMMRRGGLFVRWQFILSYLWLLPQQIQWRLQGTASLSFPQSASQTGALFYFHLNIC